MLVSHKKSVLPTKKLMVHKGKSSYKCPKRQKKKKKKLHPHLSQMGLLCRLSLCGLTERMRTTPREVTGPTQSWKLRKKLKKKLVLEFQLGL